MRRPHGGHVMGASPQIPFADDLSARQGDLICPQDQLLDLRMVQSWYQSGALKGGLWLPDWAYLAQDSAGLEVTATGQVIGLWRDSTSDSGLGLEKWTSPQPTITQSGGSSGAYDTNTQTISNTSGTNNSYPRFYFNLGLTVGRVYFVVGALSGDVGDLSSIRLAQSGSTSTLSYNSTTGAFVGFVVAGAQGMEFLLNSLLAPTSLTISSISVKELLGNYATQTTTANKPLTALTPITRRPWLTADSTDVLPVVFPADVGKCNWTEVAGQLNSQTNIRSLVEFNGKLYGGTTPTGRLFEWNGTNAWVEVAGQYSSQLTISALAVFNGNLYGGSYPGGKLLKWNGTNAWVEVAGLLNSQTFIYSLAVFNGKLYGGTYPNGKLFEWNGTNAWVEVAGQLSAQTDIRSLAVFNGKLYGGAYPEGRLFEWNGTDSWVEVAGQLNSQIGTYSLTIFNGKLYGGTQANGKLFEWNGSNAWVEVAGTLNSQSAIYSLAVLNGKLYGGTGSGGRLFEWNGTNAWVEVAGQLNSQTEIRTLTVFNGKLYGGTGDTGRLFEFSRNACTIARATPTGVTFEEDQRIYTTWNDLVRPYQYNSAVLVADRQLTAREKAIVSRVLGAYVADPTSRSYFALNLTGGGGINLGITTETSGETVIIDWGDASSTTTTSGTTVTHTYADTYSGDVAVQTNTRIRQWSSTLGKWSFNLSSLPSGLTYFYCSGYNAVTGNLSSLPSGLTYFYCSGYNAVTGNLSSLPSGLTYFLCTGLNTVTGNLSSLPAGLTYFTCTGSTTVTGNLSSLPFGVTLFHCTGYNTVTGNLSSLPAGLTYFYCTGSTTVTGNLSSLPSGVNYFVCTGANTISDYSGKAWASNQQRIYLVPVATGGLSSAEIDQLLIDLAAAGGTWSGDKQVDLRGTNAARTSASDSAVATLQGKGVTVTTN